MCGINASTSQWCGCIFILCYAHLKLALLLHKQGLVATGIATTVSRCYLASYNALFLKISLNKTHFRSCAYLVSGSSRNVFLYRIKSGTIILLTLAFGQPTKYPMFTPLWNIQITLDGLAEDKTTSF